MTDAIDIYRAAKLVIDRHGEDAALYAAARTRYSLAGATSRALPSSVRSLRRSRSCSERGDRGRR